MKYKNIFLFISTFLIAGCEGDNIKEVPTDVFLLNLKENTVGSLSALLPENQDITQLYPEFFSDTIQKQIVLVKESNVYVTFIYEGAGYRNSLHWYSYDKATPPQNVADIQYHVLFPNISTIDDGGKLEPGYSLPIGKEKLPAGTVIGFFLVLNGWSDGTIDYTKPTQYTDCLLNDDGNQQHILFKMNAFNYLFVGFEDVNYATYNCDKDFNDALFAVSDNIEGRESTSFDLTGVV
ncbi:MAG: DUF4114 domain-containing protein, partial [Bacteroidales bacterium]|nr:DUF4114 domain-containing protein [Bacteroidales bacterium]